MVWYFIYPHYTDEYKTRLNVNVPNNYKSIQVILRHKINKQNEINKGKTSHIKIQTTYKSYNNT